LQAPSKGSFKAAEEMPRLPLEIRTKSRGNIKKIVMTEEGVRPPKSNSVFKKSDSVNRVATGTGKRPPLLKVENVPKSLHNTSGIGGNNTSVSPQVFTRTSQNAARLA